MAVRFSIRRVAVPDPVPESQIASPLTLRRRHLPNSLRNPSSPFGCSLTNYSTPKCGCIGG